MRTEGRAEQGQATVEFAIILPLLLLLIVGLIQFGKAFNYWLSLNHIANETARWAAVDKLPPTNTTPQIPDFQSYAVNQAQNVELRDLILDKARGGGVCLYFKGAGDSPTIGDAATVEVSAPFNLPLVSDLAGWQIQLTGRSTVRLEQRVSDPGWDKGSCGAPGP
jgi:Flp pilus assembly protein TadG